MTPAPLGPRARLVVALAWALCPATLAGEAYAYWRTGADLDRSGVASSVWAHHTAIAVFVAYVLAQTVTAWARLYAAPQRSS